MVVCVLAGAAGVVVCVVGVVVAGVTVCVTGVASGGSTVMIIVVVAPRPVLSVAIT